MNTFSQLYLFIAFAFSVAGLRWHWIGIIGLFVTAVAAVLIGYLAPEEIAQDRMQYFSWYARAQTGQISDLDLLFNLMLTSLPSRLTPSGLFLFFNSVTIGLLTLVVFKLGKWIGLERSLIPLCVFIIFADRIWFDMMYNTLRSTLSILFFLAALPAGNSAQRLILLIFSIGTHFYAGLVSLTVYLIFRFFEMQYGRMIIITLTCILFFLAKVFGVGPEVTVGPEIMAGAFDERVARGLDVVDTEFSQNRLIQIAISLILPLVFVAWNYRSRQKFSKLELGRSRLWVFSVIVTLGFLLSFPQYPLSMRFIAIPLIALLLLLSRPQLVFIAFLKVPVILYLLG